MSKLKEKSFKIFVANAFTSGSFSGNPAAYIPLTEWLPDATLQALAEQNNLSETVFTVREKKGDNYHIRWFTPTVEVKLCGHATLACAYVLFNEYGHLGSVVNFNSKSGPISVSKSDSLLTLDFPTDQIEKFEINLDYKGMLGADPIETYRGKDDLLLIYERADDVINMKPNFIKLAEVKTRGIIVTAPGPNPYDFISRGFFPASGINEDPATGSAHTTLSPYWAQRLNKNELSAKQWSQRGGYFSCNYMGNRTQISGKCESYLAGEITI